ncbi:nitroreductase family protein [Desulfobacterales bacterium HSG2]|nr:nitroreductase family protein [Desulfobacterales bacterium HSG2]
MIKVIEDLIKKNRSCRRFCQDHPVEKETLKALVNLARLSASAANLQPLKYILSCDPKMNAEIFPCLGWAGYLKDWPGPEEGERPSAYVIILGDTRISRDFGCDHGIASQSILLGAREKGLAGCMIGSVNREKLRDILEIPSQFEILLVLAIGKPGEKVVIETVGADRSIRYWRDDDGSHHVPKRDLNDIILNCFYPN